MLRCMRTTVNLDDNLLRDAKQAAARSGRTLGALIEDALRVSLLRTEERGHEPVRLLTVPGGQRPGVDLSDNAALLDLMDSDDAAP